jgi:hypothetical protein
VGVAEYKLTKRLPKKYQAELPTPQELKEQLLTARKDTASVTGKIEKLRGGFGCWT